MCKAFAQCNCYHPTVYRIDVVVVRSICDFWYCSNF